MSVAAEEAAAEEAASPPARADDGVASSTGSWPSRLEVGWTPVCKVTHLVWD